MVDKLCYCEYMTNNLWPPKLWGPRSDYFTLPPREWSLWDRIWFILSVPVRLRRVYLWYYYFKTDVYLLYNHGYVDQQINFHCRKIKSLSKEIHGIKWKKSLFTKSNIIYFNWRCEPFVDITMYIVQRKKVYKNFFTIF